MARVKQAIQIIRYEIEKMEFQEEENFIRGMINLAERLSKITHEEAQMLYREAEEKYFQL